MFARIFLFAFCACAVSGDCVLAATSDIHAMVSGGQVLELAENRQVTFGPNGWVFGAWISPNGRYVAYAAVRDPEKSEMPRRLCVIPATGGRTSVLLDGWYYGQVAARIEAEGPQPGEELWLLGDANELAWSPDSKLIAFVVRHIDIGGRSGDDMGVEEDLAVVYKASGPKCASFPFPKDIHYAGAFCWSGDSRRFAVAILVPAEKGQYKPVMLVFDLPTGSVQTLVPAEVEDLGGVEVDGWTANGDVLYVPLYMAGRGKTAQLRAISLDGKSDRVIVEDYRGWRSPDRSFRLATEAPEGTIAIENCLTGETVNIAKGSRTNFRGWAPNSRIFAYRRHESIRDETGKRSKTLNTLWLATPEAHKLNHMCVALDSDDSDVGLLPTWSTDSMKMAYIWRGRAYVAELARRTPTVSEKVAAGIPLTEEEEKGILLANARQIGLAMHMYAQDWDGEFPPADRFMKALGPYMGRQDIFFRPGTDQNVFQYFPQTNMSDISSPSDTPIGIFDIGYGWKIVLYADGHVKVVQKS